MIVCDGCLKFFLPSDVDRIKVQGSVLLLSTDLCSGCTARFLSDVRRSLASMRPTDLREFVKSLTPDQEAQVWTFINSKYARIPQ